MDTLQTLGTALGLSALAGIDLYLTTLLAGVAIHFNLLQLSDKYADLGVLGSPWVIGIAAISYLCEFFADKVPWLDSFWDVAHTVIRPIGGAFLVLGALGTLPSEVKVIATLLGGTVALSTHLAKTGSRLLINASPEPVSNFMMSLGEDAVVFGGIALTFVLPAIALFVFLVLLVVLWTLIPKLLRLVKKSWTVIRAKLWRSSPV